MAFIQKKVKKKELPSLQKVLLSEESEKYTLI